MFLLISQFTKDLKIILTHILVIITNNDLNKFTFYD